MEEETSGMIQGNTLRDREKMKIKRVGLHTCIDKMTKKTGRNI